MAHICRIVIVHDGRGCIVDLVNKKILNQGAVPMSDEQVAEALQPHIVEFLKRAGCEPPTKP
jgi:hypothetical protein